MGETTCKAKAEGPHLIGAFGATVMMCDLDVNRKGRHRNGQEQHVDPVSDARWTDAQVKKLAKA